MFYSQLDFPNVYLGFSTKSTLKGYGCIVVSFANALGKDPAEMNKWLKENGCFLNEEGKKGWLVFDRIAKALGTSYKKIFTLPSEICLAETYDTSAPQHFFLYNPQSDTMVDPLVDNPNWEKCTYNIKSFRVIEGLVNDNDSDPVVTSIEIPDTVKDSLLFLARSIEDLYWQYKYEKDPKYIRIIEKKARAILRECGAIG